MSVAKVLWVRFLGQIEAALPRRLIPFWKAPAGEYYVKTVDRQIMCMAVRHNDCKFSIRFREYQNKDKVY